MMKQRSIQQKLIVGFFSVIIVFMIPIGSRFFFQSQMDTYNQQIAGANDCLMIVQTLNFKLKTLDGDGANYLLSTTTEERDDYNKKYETDIQDVKQLVQLLKGKTLNKQDQDDIVRFENQWTSYMAQKEVSFKTVTDGKEDDARKLYIGISFDPVIDSLLNYTERQKKMIQQYQQATMNLQKNAGIVDWITLIASIVIALILAFRLSSRISKPIRELSQVAVQIAEGDLQVEMVKSKSNDEIANLVNAMNQMAEKLRDLITKVEGSSEQVTGSAHWLQAEIGKSNEATNQVMKAIQEVASGAEQQKESFRDHSIAMEEMAVGVQRIAESASVVADLATETSQKARQGNQQIQQIRDQIKSVALSVEESDAITKDLAQKSNQINQIIEVITGIAAQTNLLALNASIEAARAGAYGRGFAVVATEVRKLAEQSNASANQVRSIIQAIQDDAKSSVKAMGKVLQDVEESENLMRQAEDTFKGIVEFSASAASHIIDTFAITEEISAGAEEITTSVQGLDQIAQESAAAAQQVSTIAENQFLSMHLVLDGSLKLNEMAQELTQAVNQFRL
jgi:methyl-accepting chemotaxis protein